MDRDTVLRKVRACLRLSKSANAHEAAAALRQAEKLMAEYRIEHGEVDDTEADPITQRSTHRRGEKPPVYVVALLNLVSEVFGVEVFRESRWRSCNLHIVGPSVEAEIAMYAFDVLLRQLERDRRKFLARVRKTANRAARGDVFGLGWVNGVEENLTEFAGRPRDPRIAIYMQRKYPNLTTTNAEARKSKAVSMNDGYAGVLSGRNAKLARGVGGSARPLIGHEASAP